MLFNQNDTFIGASLRKYGEYSKDEMDLFAWFIQPGMTVLEGGANIGAHTVGLSQIVGPTGRVFAFEPQRLMFQTLCGNLALNSCVNVHAFQAALGDKAGQLCVPAPAADRATNFGGVSLIGCTQGEVTPVSIIDDLQLADCDFIKLDVEGMEVEALAGASGTVQARRPFIYAENDRRDRSEALLSLLMSWEYRLYWHSPRLFSEDNFNRDPQNIFGRMASLNVFCVPREKGVLVKGLEEITSAQAKMPMQF